VTVLAYISSHFPFRKLAPPLYVFRQPFVDKLYCIDPRASVLWTYAQISGHRSGGATLLTYRGGHICRLFLQLRTLKIQKTPFVYKFQIVENYGLKLAYGDY